MRRSAAFGMTAVVTGLLLFAGCQAADDAEPALGAAAPMDMQGLDTTWEYLVIKYDADGDGRVSAAEYKREGGRFDRLDRDRDGALTPADFERGRGNMMLVMQSQRIIGRYFQDDDDNQVLAIVELERTAIAYDANGDGVITQVEFVAVAEARQVPLAGDDSEIVRRVMEDADPWETLVAYADADDDGHVAVEELLVVFRRQDDDGDLVWNIRDPGARRGRGGGARAERPVTGPEAGSPAPDFTLFPPEGGMPTHLASLQGNKPVALIFGSYT